MATTATTTTKTTNDYKVMLCDKVTSDSYIAKSQTKYLKEMKCIYCSRWNSKLSFEQNWMYHQVALYYLNEMFHIEQNISALF